MAAPTKNPLTNLLVTKLRPPRLGRGIVPRPRLLDLLREGFDAPLTLVTAPAGYGKTTAVIGALAGFSGSWGWVSIDEHDNEFPTFIEHAVAAIRTAFPDAGRATLSLLRQPRLPSVDLLARTLANELAELPRGCLLVLDEYDAIQNPIVHATLDALLLHPDLRAAPRDRLPRSPALSLGAPAHAWAVTEIGTADLRFTRIGGAGLPRAQLRHLPCPTTPRRRWRSGPRDGPPGCAWSRSRWATSAIRRGCSPCCAARVRATVREFLLAESSRANPRRCRQFLLWTAPFDRVCGPLCDAVLARLPSIESSQVVLERLARANLFVVALDERGEPGSATMAYFGMRCGSAWRSKRTWLSGRRSTRGPARGSRDTGLIEEAVDHALLAGAARPPPIWWRPTWPRRLIKSAGLGPGAVACPAAGGSGPATPRSPGRPRLDAAASRSARGNVRPAGCRRRLGWDALLRRQTTPRPKPFGARSRRSAAAR